MKPFEISFKIKNPEALPYFAKIKRALPAYLTHCKLHVEQADFILQELVKSWGACTFYSDYWGTVFMYFGSVLNGKPNGLGVCIFSPKMIEEGYYSFIHEYVGQFLLNKFHGYGQILTYSGDKYAGDFRNDQICGYGRRVSKEGIASEGIFQSFFSWVGRRIMVDERVESGIFVKDELISSWEGEIIDGKPRGKCKKVLVDGSVCEGIFEDFGRWEGIKKPKKGRTEQGCFVDDELLVAKTLQ